MFPWTLYPYTNFQECNLDYLLSHVKAIEEYLKTIDPSADIEAIIQQMIDDGDFQNIVDATLLADKVNRANTKVWSVGYYSNTDSVKTMDCHIVKLLNKVLLIDAGATPTGATHPAVTLMTAEGITKVDYIYISHYHEDHVGGLAKIVAGVDCTGATIFLPKAPTSLYDTTAVINAYNAVLSIASSNAMTVIYPGEGENFTLTDNESITFFNTDPSRYYGVDYRYNDCSLCGMLYNYKTGVFFDGDVEKAAQSYLATVVPSCYAKKFSHHGTSASGDVDYFNRLAPRFYFGTDGYGTSNDGYTTDLLSSWGFETTYAAQNDIPIFATSCAPNYIMCFEFGERLFQAITPRYKNERISERNTSSASIVEGYTAEAKTKSIEDFLDLMDTSEYLEFNAEFSTWACCPSYFRDGCFVQINKNSSANTQNALADYDGTEYAYVRLTPHKHGGFEERVYKKSGGTWTHSVSHHCGSFILRDGTSVANDGTEITSDISSITTQIGDSWAIENGQLVCKDYGYYTIYLYTTNTGTTGDLYYSIICRDRSGSLSNIVRVDNAINATGENYENAVVFGYPFNPGDIVKLKHKAPSGNTWFKIQIDKAGFR